MDTQPLVSVIVPYHNARATLRTCLEAVFASSYPRLQVITVDDGSTDDGFETVDDLPCHHVSLPRQSGAAVARNVGATAAGGEILLFLDADVKVRPDVIEKAVAALAADPDLAAVFGAYAFDAYHGNFASVFKNIVHHYTHLTSRSEATTFWCGCGAVWTTIFRRVGMFDESFAAASVEDIDLGYRLTQTGHRIRLEKAMRVTHMKRYTFAYLIKSDVMDRAVPWTKLMARRNVFRADLNLRWHNVASGVALSVLFLWLFSGVFTLPPAGVALLAVVTLLIYVALNGRLLWYVKRRKGVPFAIGFAAMFLLSYLYSVAGFALGLALYAKDKIEGKERL